MDRKILPILVFEEKYSLPFTQGNFIIDSESNFEALKDAISLYDNFVIVASRKNEGDEDIYKYATISKISNAQNKKNGSISVTLMGIKPIVITDFINSNIDTESKKTHRKGVYTEIVPYCSNIDENNLLVKKVNKMLNNLNSMEDDVTTTRLKLLSKKWENNLSLIYDIADQFTYVDKQLLIAAYDINDMMIELCRGIEQEIQLAKLDKKINDSVAQSMLDHQKESFLRAQLKAIGDELNDNDEEYEELYDNILDIEADKNVTHKLLGEYKKLGKLSTSSADYYVIRNYLEFCVKLPWGKYDQEDIDIVKAKSVLDSEHYAMKDVKERILEFIAVRKLAKNNNGSIICFVGAPGVGKTSIVKSIAEALNKKYVRVSLGGVRDEAEIRGHRRTYIGAMAGRIMNGIKDAGTSNPVFLLDEIDKLTTDMRGDPASALLEALDPAQNNTFTDHYVDLPYDLSKTLFITTANTTDTIPRALLDRMELIEMSGYTILEKIEIAKRHLIPKLCKQCGIKHKIKIEDNVIAKVISEYTRESGVRELNRNLEKICRRVATNIVSAGKQRSYSITLTNINKYLGTPKYLDSVKNNVDEVGQVTGLAWTVVGGDILNIEVSLYSGKGEIVLTGQLGDVMKESARAAISYLRSNADKYNIDSAIFTTKDIHIHVPEGAVKKDGPSAGVTIATAVLSALTNRKVKSNTAMTGEITLKGKVLPIGGLKEKMLAALRAGIINVILPSENIKDISDIPEEITSNLNLIYVNNVDAVFNNAINA